MISLSVLLKHYKRKDIQEEMIEHAKEREIAVRFSDKFGKRPDVLTYPSDIMEFAKQGATSFHASEELWSNPLHLDPKLRKKDLDNLRVGWDLVLDIDCPYWEYSKLITHLMIKVLKKHGVKSISCKFSGNKGFHIGVPFEAFPRHTGIGDTRLWFPDGVRIIAMYLTDYIDSKETDFELSRSILKGKNIEDIAKELGVPYKDLVKVVCGKCDSVVKENRSKNAQVCLYCDAQNPIEKGKNYFQCMKCKKLNNVETSNKFKCPNPKCNSEKFSEKFNISKILDVDTLLISSRHMYRMPYSLHEKSGLCSVPVDPEKVLEFDKKEANPDGLNVSKFKFLERKNVLKGDANNLFDQAGYWSKNKSELSDLEERYSGDMKNAYEMPTVALNEKFFPPCITSLLSGVPDGRKRTIFILINFLSMLGWSYEEIEKKLKEWNKKNEEQLKEVYLVGQLRYYKQRKEKILPPNCDNKGYYTDMRVCNPDNLCNKVKNPVNYSIRKTRYLKVKKDKPDEKVKLKKTINTENKKDPLTK